MTGTVTKKHVKMGRRRGIYLLPNLFTTAGLLSGFFAIIAAMQHHFSTAAVAIFVAMVFDSLDGRVARLIKAQSAFGGQYDSLSDMVAFGLAPALVLYKWCLEGLSIYHLHKLGWLSAFIYVACVALRLAKFNTQVELTSSTAKRYFFGLPCPAGAALIAAMIWVGSINQMHGLWVALFAVLVSIVVGLLMVSNIRYRSFKDVDLSSTVRFTALIGVVIVLACIALRPAWMLLALSLLYILSGPLMALHKAYKRRLGH